MSFNNKKKLNDGADGIYITKEGLVMRIDHYDNVYEQEFDEDDEETYGSLVYYIHAPNGEAVEDFNLLYRPGADFTHLEEVAGIQILKEIPYNTPGYEELDNALYLAENTGNTDQYMRIKRKFGLPNKKPSKLLKKIEFGSIFRRR